MSELPPSGKPNYGSAVRVAQIIHWLHQFPYGISTKELSSRLGISERTMARYVGILKDSFDDEEGEPLVELIRPGGQGSRLRFKRKGVEIKGTAYELMSLYMALDLMAFLDGTFFQEGVQDALDRMQKTLQQEHGNETNLVLKDFHKKFYHWTEAPKDYSEHNTILDKLVRALVYQKKVEILYKSPKKPEKRHALTPLSLLMFKRGLYLIGRREAKGEEARDLTFAVERIKDVAVLEETFNYPYDYEPADRFQHTFGLVREREPEEIELQFSATVAQGVGSRRWHPSQELEWLESGAVILKMRIEVGSELIGWLLGYGAFVKVINPPSLRMRMIDELQSALTQYEDEDA